MTKLGSMIRSIHPVDGASIGPRRKPVRTPGGAPPHRPAPPAVFSAPLGRRIGPRRAIWGGWVAADEQAVVVHREGRDDVRIPHTHLRQVWLEGRNLALVAVGGESLYLMLTTFRPSWDRRFVEAVATAAGHRVPPGRPVAD